MTVEYRWLEREQLDELEPKLVQHGWPSLNPNTSRAIAAYDDGKLVGFLVLQLFPHIEPIYVDRDHRGTDIASELVRQMIEFVTEIKIRGWMCVADSDHAEKMCREHGMKKLESPVYVA